MALLTVQWETKSRMIGRLIVVRPMTRETVCGNGAITAAGMAGAAGRTCMSAGQNKSRVVVGCRYPGGGRMALLAVLGQAGRHMIRRLIIVCPMTREAVGGNCPKDAAGMTTDTAYTRMPIH